MEISNSLVRFSEHSTVTLVQQIGGDDTVLASMLVSTQAEASLAMLEEDAEGSEGRIRYLMKNRHGTPFEHNLFTFFIQAPIFVFREFHRHRIGWSYNEESGRYKQLEPHFWIPPMERPLAQEGKPGAYVMVPVDKQTYMTTIAILTDSYRYSYKRYENLLELGIAREVARACLPVAIFSSMYATCNARSLMAFLSLRTESERALFKSTPMKEIAEVADKIEQLFAEAFPITYKAFCDYGRVCP